MIFTVGPAHEAGPGAVVEAGPGVAGADQAEVVAEADPVEGLRAGVAAHLSPGPTANQGHEAGHSLTARVRASLGQRANLGLHPRETIRQVIQVERTRKIDLLQYRQLKQKICFEASR